MIFWKHKGLETFEAETSASITRAHIIYLIFHKGDLETGSRETLILLIDLASTIESSHLRLTFYRLKIYNVLNTTQHHLHLEKFIVKKFPLRRKCWGLIYRPLFLQIHHFSIAWWINLDIDLYPCPPTQWPLLKSKCPWGSHD